MQYVVLFGGKFSLQVAGSLGAICEPLVSRLPSLKTMLPEPPNPRKIRGSGASEPLKPRLAVFLLQYEGKPKFFKVSSHETS